MAFVGDDWAEAHHDAHLMDGTGRALAHRRLPERLEGVRVACVTRRARRGL